MSFTLFKAPFFSNSMKDKSENVVLKIPKYGISEKIVIPIIPNQTYQQK